MILIMNVFFEVDLSYPDIIREKTKNFPIFPENKAIPKDKNNECMKKLRPKSYTKAEKIICDWSDKKNSLIHYRMLKLYVRHGMVNEKVMKQFHIDRVSGRKNI